MKNLTIEACLFTVQLMIRIKVRIDFLPQYNRMYDVRDEMETERDVEGGCGRLKMPQGALVGAVLNT